MSKRILNKTKESRKTKVLSVFSVKDTKTEDFSCRNSLTLYRFVYASRASVLVAFLLFISFFVQGVQNVYANEDAEASLQDSVSYQAPLMQETEVTAEPEVNTEEPEVIDIEIIEPSADTQVAGGNDSEDSLSEELDEELTFDTDSTSTTTQSEDVSTSTSNPQVSTSTSEILSDYSADNNAETEGATPDIDITDEETVAAEINSESVSITESDSAFSFTSDECTQLATGSFYCQKPQVNVLEDALFSAPDEDGDTEIFLVRGGKQVQVTRNNVDDAAPYFDQNSNTIVWHRLVNDRFQIISYDVDSQQEKQLTQTSENNMEPTRQGSYTVWQRWVDGGWNIVLSDGSKETQITRTSSHNVAPYIHGSLVVWNRHNNDGTKTIEMYDMTSQTYVTVDDPDGMAVSNPRMVFVYDSLHPNGDIVTKGYDVLAHKFIDLGTLPKQLPEDIPDSDSTGETRALIQSKPSIKYEVGDNVTGSTTPPTADIPVDLIVSTSSDVDMDQVSDTVLEPESESNASSTATSVEEEVSEPFIDSAVAPAEVADMPEMTEIEEFVMPIDEFETPITVQE